MWSPKAPQYLSHSPPPVTNNDLSLSFFIWFSSLLLPYSVQSLSLFLIFYLLHIPLVFLCIFFLKKINLSNELKELHFINLYLSWILVSVIIHWVGLSFSSFFYFSAHISQGRTAYSPPPPPASAHSLHTGIFDKRISLIIKLTISRTFRIPWRVIKGPEFTEAGILRPLSKI